MNTCAISTTVIGIVESARALKNKHTDELNAPVNYACIFSQDWASYEELLASANELGVTLRETPTGPLYKISPLLTIAGELQLLKIRMPDPSRPERGDADFTVSDYISFKDKWLRQVEFTLIRRENFEMIELVDASFDVRAYFSNPPLTTQFGIK